MLSLLPPRVTILHVLASHLLREVQQCSLSLVSCSSSSLRCQSHGHQCYLMTLGWERERDSTSILPLSEFFGFLQPILDFYMARIGGSAWEPLIIRSSFVVLVCGLLLCAEPSGDACFLPSLHPSWRMVLLTSQLNGFSSCLTLTCPSVSLTPPISVVFSILMTPAVYLLSCITL